MHNGNNKITYLFPLSITPLEMPPKEIEKKEQKQIIITNKFCYCAVLQVDY